MTLKATIDFLLILVHMDIVLVHKNKMRCAYMYLIVVILIVNVYVKGEVSIFLIRSDCMLLPKMHGYYNYYQEAILIVNTYYVYIYNIIMIMLMQHQATHILAR